MATKITDKKPRGLLRWALRAPIWLYRARLGFVLGGRFLLLVHRGRKSGKTRRTVLEVVEHEPGSEVWIVASGWGPKADWFQNVMATPEVEIMAGARRLPARAKRLDLEEATATLARYAERNPRAFHQLGKFMIGRGLSPTEADCRELAEHVPLVRLEPR